jgi:hypothetical protein
LIRCQWRLHRCVERHRSPIQPAFVDVAFVLDINHVAGAVDVATKPPITADLALLNNITANPDGTDCFTYQQQTVNGTPYVLDVAITLTVKTPNRDATTGLFETETKALLNVSPRNVFNIWQLAGLGVSNRVQPMPASVQTLLGQS